MGAAMTQEELSKRIDDVHRRLDDLRADGLQLRQEVGQLRQDMVAGFGQLRQEVHHELNRRSASSSGR
ncbi:MAG: hypothetical protein HY347_08155 [candidate division NC10 bacterium]|nr:hypothetical protein [candidate division NC10 bacterium]